MSLFNRFTIIVVIVFFAVLSTQCGRDSLDVHSGTQLAQDGGVTSETQTSSDEALPDISSETTFYYDDDGQMSYMSISLENINVPKDGSYEGCIVAEGQSADQAICELITEGQTEVGFELNSGAGLMLTGGYLNADSEFFFFEKFVKIALVDSLENIGSEPDDFGSEVKAHPEIFKAQFAYLAIINAAKAKRDSSAAEEKPTITATPTVESTKTPEQSLELEQLLRPEESPAP